MRKKSVSLKSRSN